jgi:hypothetical protein
MVGGQLLEFGPDLNNLYKRHKLRAQAKKAAAAGKTTTTPAAAPPAPAQTPPTNP